MTKPARMTAYEIVETIRNHPTTFQFRRRKSTLRSVRLLVRHQIVFDHDVGEEARDEDRGDEGEDGTPEERVGEAFDRPRPEDEEDARTDDRREVAVENGRKRAREARPHGGPQGLARPELFFEALEDQDVRV